MKRKEFEQMQIIAIHKTSNYRGDHSADVEIVLDVDPKETVESLLMRIAEYYEEEKYANPLHDSIIIKLIK